MTKTLFGVLDSSKGAESITKEVNSFFSKKADELLKEADCEKPSTRSRVVRGILGNPFKHYASLDLRSSDVRTQGLIISAQKPLRG